MPFSYQERLAAQAHSKLRKVKFSTLEMKRLEMKIKQLDDKLLHTDSLPVMSKNGQNTRDKFGHNRLLLADIKELLLTKLAESEKISLDAENRVNQLQSALERIILKRYYLDGKTTEDIAAELHFSRSYIVKVKRNALIEYEKTLAKESESIVN